MDVYKYLIEPLQQLTKLRLEYWLKYSVFTMQWWIMILVLIIPWIFWRKKLDKKRIKEISLYGFFIMFFSLVLDEIGTMLALWAYPYIFTPLSIRFEPYDYSILPVVYMLVYQRISNWKSFVLAQCIIAAIFSFILEPITVYFNIYKMINWRYEYSFFIYPLLGMLCKLIIHKINKIETT